MPKPIVCIKDPTMRHYGTIEPFEGFEDPMLPREGMVAMTKHTYSYYTWEIKPKQKRTNKGKIETYHDWWYG